MLWRNDPQPARPRPPGFINPCRPTPADKVPTGTGWLHEIKHDGYRMLVRKTSDRVRLYTRRGYDWTDRYPFAMSSALRLAAKSATLDCELVCTKKNGVSCFDTLHNRLRDREAFLYAFDLLEQDGMDLRARPLIERKAMLAELLAERITLGIHLVEHETGNGPALFKAACKMGLEGIVSKKIDSKYVTGPKPCKSWVKVRNKKAPGYLRVRDGLDG